MTYRDPEQKKAYDREYYETHTRAGVGAGARAAPAQGMARKYKLIEDAADHYKVQHPDGRVFKVAKRGLGAGLISKIQSFAEGGEVSQVPGPLDPNLEEGQSVDPVAPVPQVTAAPETTPEPQLGAGGDILSDPLAESVNTTVGPALAEGLEATNDPLTMAGFGMPVGSPQRVAAEARFKTMHPEQPEGPVAPPPGSEPAAPEQPLDPDQALSVATSTPMQMDVGRIGHMAAPQLTPLVNEEDKQKAVFEEGEAKKNYELTKAASIEAYQQRAQEVVQEQDTELQDRRARADKLWEEFVTQKVDPTHFWTSKTNWGKARGVLGIILGGIGSGLTGKENVVLNMINKFIDQDIDAQKSNINIKKSSLEMYREQTTDLQQMFALKKADMKTALAAELERVAANSNSVIVQKNAQVAIAQIKMDADKDREGVAQANAALKMQTAHMNMQADIANQRAQMTAASMAVKRSQMAYERQVVLPNGTVGFATSLNGKKLADEAVVNYGQVNQLLAKALEIARQDPHGLFIPGTDRMKNAEQVRTMLTFTVAKTFDKSGKISDADRKLFETVVPDPTKVTWNPTAMEAQIKMLQKVFADRVSGTLRQHVVPISQAPRSFSTSFAVKVK